MSAVNATRELKNVSGKTTKIDKIESWRLLLRFKKFYRLLSNNGGRTKEG